jgi:hypothetical protein
VDDYATDYTVPIVTLVIVGSVIFAAATNFYYTRKAQIAYRNSLERSTRFYDLGVEFYKSMGMDRKV